MTFDDKEIEGSIDETVVNPEVTTTSTTEGEGEAITQPSETQEEGVTSSASGSEGEQTPPQVDEALIDERVNEKLNKIMHERTKSFAEELGRYRSLGSPEDIEGLVAQTRKAAEPKLELTDEDRKVREYLETTVPELKILMEHKKELEEIVLSRREATQARAQQLQTFCGECTNEVEKLCSERGVTNPVQIAGVAHMVSRMAASDPQYIERFAKMDKTFVKDVMDSVLPVFEKAGENRALANLAATKKKLASSSTRGLPVGGAPDSSAPNRKLTDEERLDKAFALINGTNKTNPEDN